MTLKRFEQIITTNNTFREFVETGKVYLLEFHQIIEQNFYKKSFSHHHIIASFLKIHFVVESCHQQISQEFLLSFFQWH